MQCKNSKLSGPRTTKLAKQLLDRFILQRCRMRASLKEDAVEVGKSEPEALRHLALRYRQASHSF